MVEASTKRHFESDDYMHCLTVLGFSYFALLVLCAVECKTFEVAAQAPAN